MCLIPYYQCANVGPMWQAIPWSTDCRRLTDRIFVINCTVLVCIYIIFFINLRRSSGCLFPFVPRATFVRFRLQVTLLRYADKRIDNIMKMHIEKKNLQLELIRYRKKSTFYVYFWVQCTESSPAMLAYSLDGSTCSSHAARVYFNVSNTNQFDHC